MLINNAKQVSFRVRFATYAVIWILAALSCGVFIGTESPAENSDSPLKQRFSLAAWCPVITALGIAEACVWPRELWFTRSWISIVSLLFFPAHAVIALTRRRMFAFASLCVFQCAGIVIGIIFYVRLASFPCGP